MARDEPLQVRLFRNNRPVAYCTPHYIGVLGMQIDAGPIVYQKGTVLEVDMLLNREDKAVNCRVPVIVTNCSYDEMGLTYLNHEMTTNRELMVIILEFNAAKKKNVIEPTFRAEA